MVLFPSLWHHFLSFSFCPAHQPLFVHPPYLVCASKSSFVLRPPSGSDSSSSVGSSSGSLPRPAQLPLPAPVLPQPGRGFTVAPAAPLPAPASQSATTNANINTNASFYIVPLDSSAIPPGSVLLNPQTGWYHLTDPYSTSVDGGYAPSVYIHDTNFSY